VAGIVIGLVAWLLSSVIVLSGAAQRVRRAQTNMLSISVMVVTIVVTVLVAASVVQGWFAR